MNNIYKYLIGATALVGMSLALPACQDHFDDYSPKAPEATLSPNMSILELKQALWSDEENYCTKIGYVVNEAGDTVDDGKQYIISGRVVSSDQAGNVYKYLILQDETAAMTIGVNSYNLYLRFRQGQEIVIDLKGMYCGRYSGLFQLGFPSFRESYGAWAPSFMAPEMFFQHIELNGYPDASKIDTIQISEFSEIGTTTPEMLQKYQSQLVKFNNVYFTNGGTEQFGAYHENVKQYFVDSNGDGSMYLYTSGYSDFWNQYLPAGNGDVCGILSWYNGWQVVLNSANGCMNFGNPTVAPGAEDNPYTIMDAIGLVQSNKSKSGWVKGYIVGAVAPEVTEIKSNSDIEWGADVTLNNTLVIGATPDTKDISQAMVIALPQGSALRTYGNLRDNPTNYKKQISVKGTFGTYMETYGILDNKGKVSEFKIEGVEIPDDTTKGDGTEASPYGVEQVVAMNPSSTTEAVQSGVWVEGYIVGSIPTGGATTALEGTEFGTANAATSNLVIAPSADCTDYKQCVAVQLPSGSDVRSALNLKDNPGKLGAKVDIKGDVMKYCGGPGLKNTSAYKVISGGNNDNPNPPASGGEGTGTESDPFDVAKVIAMNPTSTTEAVQSGVWVDGYIVGSIPTGGSTTVLEGTEFGTANAAVANLVLGPSADCKDYTQCIAVQLPSGSDVRSALNLKDNPGKLGSKVTLKGDVMKYCGGPGLKNTSAYKVDGSGSDNPNPPVSGGEGTGEGTEASPYNVERALYLINNNQMSSEKVYVKGIISEVKEVSTQYGNATYMISDDGKNTSALTVFRGRALNGENFTSEDQIKVGDAVVILGQLIMYNNTTPEVATGSSIISLNGSTETPDTPVTPPAGGDDENGTGTEASPYTVGQVIAKGVDASETGVWVIGFIVGSVSGNNISTGCEFDVQNPSNTNFLLAPTADCKDYTQCIPVQLPTALRADLSLQNNPSNLGKKVELQGDIAKYFNVPGFKNTAKFIWK